MRQFIPALLLALLLAAFLATPVLAQEPDALGTGAIAEVCKQKFPGDAEASKACEVTIRVIIDHEVDVRIDRLQMLVDALWAALESRDVKLLELERRIAEIEASSPKNK